MTDRRKFLTGVTAAAAGAMAVETGKAAARPAVPLERTVIDKRKRDSFPAANVTSHLGESLRFYEDLIHDKVVMVNFMSIATEEMFPVTQFIASVAEQLGDRLGRDVFINSVTSDPERDTPRALLDFAKSYGLRDGWRFLTTSTEETTALSLRMYRRRPDLAQQGRAKKVDIVFYGNGSAGVWGTFPVDINPADAASRMSWVMPRERGVGLRRAGPRKLATASPQVSTNREI